MQTRGHATLPTRRPATLARRTSYAHGARQVPTSYGRRPHGKGTRTLPFARDAAARAKTADEAIAKARLTLPLVIIAAVVVFAGGAFAVL